MMKDILGILLFIGLAVGVLTKIFFIHFAGVGLVLLVSPVIILYTLTEQLVQLIELARDTRRRKIDRANKEQIPNRTPAQSGSFGRI